MQWSEPRDLLIPTKINFKNLYYKPKVANLDRNKILKKVNYTCRTCGGTYKTYLILTYVLKENCFDMYCNACHIITHLNTGLSNGIDIYYSKLSQLDIIKKTIDYIIINQKSPDPKLIDPLIKESPLSLFEYINLLDNINDEFSDYKIFFTENFNINFIMHNYGIINPFVDDKEENNEENNEEENDEEENDEDIIIKNQLPLHELSDIQTNILNKLFIK